ncbi:hypothetical protein QJS10_CPB13g00733 [Acorus calamus]|uniref:Uncharacterized protein n=1 Tax=Acorus calamus TaxID=4465 RepID=A0AAV9DK41_ACOCL|nr:hypothetical protein QJS10_CPB13g00733 [Acorus calamus]
MERELLVMRVALLSPSPYENISPTHIYIQGKCYTQSFFIVLFIHTSSHGMAKKKLWMA